MYGWFWSKLPGPLLARFATVLVLMVGVVLLLFTVVYPAVSPHLPLSNVTVDNGHGTTPK